MLRKIQWPLNDGNGHLSLSQDWRNDECLIFHSDGSIESNGGRVEHHEITEDQIERLPESDQQFVRSFLHGQFNP